MAELRWDDRVEGTALVAWGDRSFSVERVLAPGPGEKNIVVSVRCSGVSFGTEFGVLQGKIDWGGFPMVTGYMATGSVVAVGTDVEGFSPGDRVYLRHGEDLVLMSSGRPLNCRDGLHCSIASIDPTGDHGAAVLPPGVPDEEGSLFVVLSVGLYGVDLAGVRTGSTVVVLGLGAIGLGVVAAAAARGARVVGLDLRERCCELARAYGAWRTVVVGAEGPEEPVHRLIGPDGADYVFESTGLPELVDVGISLTRSFGTFVWQGHYGSGRAHFNFLPAHHKRLKMIFPCDDGFAEYRSAVMRSIDRGSLLPAGLITDRLSPSEAPSFFSHVCENGSGASISAVIRWS
ncbi:MAG TPA: zinc-binding dehydrogenase [Acidimicrobiales bacterium]|nr:zinc-binding dehydrogenase [Acidimicrobiales bacterium]